MTTWVTMPNGLRVNLDNAREKRRAAAQRRLDRQRAELLVRQDGNRTTVTRKPRKPLRPVSARMERRLEEYRPLRNAFLEANPWCMRCGAPTTCLHHRKGRVGGLLMAVEYWASSCADCNDFAETHTGEALAEGWLLRAIGDAA